MIVGSGQMSQLHSGKWTSQGTPSMLETAKHSSLRVAHLFKLLVRIQLLAELGAFSMAPALCAFAVGEERATWRLETRRSEAQSERLRNKGPAVESHSEEGRTREI